MGHAGEYLWNDSQTGSGSPRTGPPDTLTSMIQSSSSLRHFRGTALRWAHACDPTTARFSASCRYCRPPREERHAPPHSFGTHPAPSRRGRRRTVPGPARRHPVGPADQERAEGQAGTMTTIPVTGGTGTLGRQMTDRLRSEGHDIRAPSRTHGRTPSICATARARRGGHRRGRDRALRLHAARRRRHGAERLINAAKRAGASCGPGPDRRREPAAVRLLHGRTARGADARGVGTRLDDPAAHPVPRVGAAHPRWSRPVARDAAARRGAAAVHRRRRSRRPGSRVGGVRSARPDVGARPGRASDTRTDRGEGDVQELSRTAFRPPRATE